MIAGTTFPTRLCFFSRRVAFQQTCGFSADVWFLSRRVVFSRGRVVDLCRPSLRQFYVTARWADSRFDIGSPNLVQF